MKICVFGLGYVGSVTTACLAELGHRVYGVDIMPQKVATLNEGVPPVKEPQLDDLLRSNLDSGRLSFTMDTAKAIIETDCALIAVGTPSNPEGKVNLVAVERCVESIANVVADAEGKTEYLIIIRSTVPPGTTERLHTLSRRILPDHKTIRFSMNPEFLREGVAVKDFFEPAVIVFGSDQPEARPRLEEVYEGIEAPTVHLNSRSAELVKYTNNAFHALKVAFANEVGRIADAYDIDGDRVMEILCMDDKLNISKKYLRPGFAFGGSCLPKDLRGISSVADQVKVEIPLLKSIITSNDAHIEMVRKQILEKGADKVAFLGFVFKSGTDDVRESPALRLIQALIERGIQVKMYDANLTLKHLMGANRRYIEELVPRWEEYYTDNLEELMSYSDVVVVPNPEAGYRELLEGASDTKTIIRLQ